MFGMSSKEFWEDDPQLYWSYRTFFYKKLELDNEKTNFESWLNGSYVFLGVSIALHNAFSKQKLEYPDKPFNKKKDLSKALSKTQKEIAKIKDKDVRNQMEYNYWARL